MDIMSFDAESAAEACVEQLAYDGEARPGDTTYVRVTDEAGAVSYFEVEVEMQPSACARPCDGDGLVFDDEPEVKP